MRRGADHLMISIRFGFGLVLHSQSPIAFIQCRFLLRALSLVLVLDDAIKRGWNAISFPLSICCRVHGEVRCGANGRNGYRWQYTVYDFGSGYRVESEYGIGIGQ